MKSVKKWSKNIGIGILIFSFSSLSTAQTLDNRLFYKVKESDQLGKIVSKLNFSKIYKKDQVLELVCKENGIKPFGDKIYPNQKIYFPVKYSDHLKENGIVLSSKEVVFKGERSVAQVTVETSTVTSSANKETATKPSVRELSPRKIKKEDKMEVGLTLKEGYYRLDGSDSTTNTQGTLLSELSPSIEVSMTALWSSYFKTTLSMEQTFLSFESLSQGSKTLENQSLNLGSLSLKNTAKLSDHASIFLDLAMEESLLYKATSATSLKILKAPTTKVGLGLDLSLLKFNDISVDTLGAYYWSGGSEVESIDISGGSQYKLGLGVSYRPSKSVKVHGGLQYESATIDTSTVQYQLQGIKASMGVLVGF